MFIHVYTQSSAIFSVETKHQPGLACALICAMPSMAWTICRKCQKRQEPVFKTNDWNWNPESAEIDEEWIELTDKTW